MKNIISPNAVLSSAEFIAKNADDIIIKTQKLNQFSETIDLKKVEHWIHSAPLDFSKLNEDQTIIFVFMFNTLSFSYWGSDGQPDYCYIKDGQTHKR